MKRILIASLGVIAVIAAIPIVSEMPVLAGWREAEATLAQKFQSQPRVQLRLIAEKKIVQPAPQRKQQVAWRTLQGNVFVQPGDVIRYTVIGENNSDRPVTNLAFTQPIPKQTTYILNSATVGQNNGAKIVYSINNGKSFVEKPTVQVKLPNGKVETRLAPAELYSYVRWNFGTSINPKTAVNGTYQVKVR